MISSNATNLCLFQDLISHIFTLLSFRHKDKNFQTDGTFFYDLAAFNYVGKIYSFKVVSYFNVGEAYKLKGKIKISTI